MSENYIVSIQDVMSVNKTVCLHLHLHVIRSVKSLDITPTVKIRKQTNKQIK